MMIMKRLTVFSLIIVSVLIVTATGCLAHVTSNGYRGETKAAGAIEAAGMNVLFEDNFEAYDVGTFPYGGGWQLWFDGAGSAYQVINDNFFVSPTKSLQLLGLDGWAGFAAKPIVTNALRIGFQVSVMVAETRGGSRDDARVSFTKWTSPSTSMEVAPVCFMDDSTIASDNKVLQSYVAGKWYKITLILDRPSDTYSVWVDDALCGENLNVTASSAPETRNPSYEIEAFSLSQCYNQVYTYFDDVEIFAEPSLIIGVPSITPVTPNYNEDAAASVAITGDAQTNQVLLSYTYDETWHNVSMVEAGGTFSATIPAQPYGTLVQYVVYANDTNGNWYHSSAYSYEVSDTFPPEITDVSWAPQDPTVNDTVKVTTNVTEPADASGVKRVLFSFKDSYGQWWNTTMTYDAASGLWNVVVPQQPHDTTVPFCITAYDNAGNMAIKENNGYTVLPEFSFAAIIVLLATTTVGMMVHKRKRAA
jgi:hypothetical protein